MNIHCFKKFTLVSSIVLCIFFTNAKAQNVVTISQGSNYILPCDSPCMVLSATHLPINKTDTYSVNSITYNPNILSSPTIVTLGDDSFSNIIPIGFNFCFYDLPFSDIVIGSNGVLSFNSSYANSACSFNASQSLPFISSTFPNLAIFGPYMDISPNVSGQIQYQTLGNYPFRKLVVQYKNIPLFGNGCTVDSNTFEIVLYEVSNKIDMHIGHKTICNSNPSDTLNYATLGLQGNILGNYITAPGKNASIWSANNVAFEFMPSGAPNAVINWSKINTNTFASGNQTSFCPLEYDTVIANLISTCPYAIWSDTIFIQHILKPNITVVIDSPICKTDVGIVTINASSTQPPLLYSINGGLLSTNNIFPNLAIGTYSFTVQDSIGCSNSVIVSVKPKSRLKTHLQVSSIPHCSFNDGGIVVYIDTAGVQPYSYLWNTGATTNSIDSIYGDSAYYCIITDALGCTDSAYWYLNAKGPDMIIDSSFKSLCGTNSGSIYIHAEKGTAPYSYYWPLTGDTTPYLLNMIPLTNYNCIVTDATGCTEMGGFYVDEINLMTINFQLNDETCHKGNGWINLIVGGGTPPYTYLWNNGATTNPITNLSSGQYFPIVTDANGCEKSPLMPIMIWSNYNMLANIFYTQHTTCNTNNGISVASANSGMPPYSFLWSNGMSNDSIFNLAPGNYTVAISDSLFCMDTLAVIINPSIGINVIPIIKNANCDTTNGSINTAITGNITAPNYLWSTGDTTVDINWVGAGVYSISVTNADGCTTLATATLFNEGSPSAFISNFIVPLCFGDSSGQLTLQALAGVSPYKYSLDGINFTPSPTVVNIKAGTYMLWVKDANSCINDTTITLTDASPILFTFSEFDSVLCFGNLAGPISVSAFGGFTPLMLDINGIGFTNNFTLDNLDEGQYVITIRDSALCTVDTSFSIQTATEPIQITATIFDNECFVQRSGKIELKTFSSWPPYKYLWNDSITTANRDSIYPGKYFVSITDSQGCKLDTAFFVDTKKCCDIWMPNAFTPNGDGDNDVFKVQQVNYLETSSLEIYDRWGEKVFQSQDKNDSWNGYYKNKAMDMGNYFYIVRYKCLASDKPQLLKGNLFLMR